MLDDDFMEEGDSNKAQATTTANRGFSEKLPVKTEAGVNSKEMMTMLPAFGVKEEPSSVAAAADIKVDSSKLPMTKGKEGEQVLR